MCNPQPLQVVLVYQSLQSDNVAGYSVIGQHECVPTPDFVGNKVKELDRALKI